MKRFLRASALLLLFAVLLSSFTACGYKMRKSSDKEATEVFTLGEDSVRFELLYTFFLNRMEVHGWSLSHVNEERYALLMNEAKAEIAEIYALFAVCREVGIDPYSKEMDKQVKEYLKINVEGGIIGDTWIEGYENYDAYLEDIYRKYHMNDAVNRLMIRYALCEEQLVSYYKTAHPYTKEDVDAFFASEDCLHVVWVGRTASDGGTGYESASELRAYNLELMEMIRTKLESGDIRGAVGLSLRPDTDFYMGRYSKDDAYYGELIEIAYGLEEGETSRVLDLGSVGFYVVKRLSKNADDLDTRYEEILEVYITDVLYTDIIEKGNELLQGIVYTDAYSTLTAGDFSTP